LGDSQIALLQDKPDLPIFASNRNLERMNQIALALHGGAGTILRSAMTPEKEAAYTAALRAALDAGYAVLHKGGSSLEAVETAVVSLEDCPLFNAGRGSVFTNDGRHEMDASIMDGLSREAGAVAMVRNVRNPIRLARMVMTHSGHVMLAGEGAMAYAHAMGVQMEDDSYFYDQLRYDQWQSVVGSEGFQLDHSVTKDEKFGTVGAVALDVNGNIAAATSTGGMTNKKFGRIGDSPIIGAGTYAANKTCAVSCTGSGEYFIRGVVAYDVSCLMEYKGLSLQAACDEVVQRRLLEIGGDGGLVALDAAGHIAMVFNTEGMYRACRSSAGRDEVGIYGDV
jgi:beta-aspartyl-peptidase (threonine type)